MWDLLELQEVMSHLIWVLGFEIDSSARVGALKQLIHLPSPSNNPYRNFKVSSMSLYHKTTSRYWKTIW